MKSEQEAFKEAASRWMTESKGEDIGAYFWKAALEWVKKGKQQPQEVADLFYGSKLALEYFRRRQQRYKNRRPVLLTSLISLLEQLDQE